MHLPTTHRSAIEPCHTPRAQNHPPPHLVDFLPAPLLPRPLSLWSNFQSASTQTPVEISPNSLRRTELLLAVHFKPLGQSPSFVHSNFSPSHCSDAATVYPPAGMGRQETQAVAPAAALYFPAGQSVQTLAAASLNVPIGQLSHRVPSIAKCVPAGQATHCSPVGMVAS
jgi:hypothetical protein